MRVVRAARRAVCSVNVSKPSRAALTASEVGKALAKAGSIRATDVPLETALWNLPRSSFTKSDFLYSGRNSSLIFFIPVYRHFGGV